MDPEDVVLGADALLSEPAEEPGQDEKAAETGGPVEVSVESEEDKRTRAEKKRERWVELEREKIRAEERAKLAEQRLVEHQQAMRQYAQPQQQQPDMAVLANQRLQEIYSESGSLRNTREVLLSNGALTAEENERIGQRARELDFEKTSIMFQLHQQQQPRENVAVTARVAMLRGMYPEVMQNPQAVMWAASTYNTKMYELGRNPYERGHVPDDTVTRECMELAANRFGLKKTVQEPTEGQRARASAPRGGGGDTGGKSAETITLDKGDRRMARAWAEATGKKFKSDTEIFSAWGRMVKGDRKKR